MDYPVAISSQIRQHLRSLRKSRGLTQTELAKRLGVGQSRVADIEADPGAISVEQLLQILAVLNAQLVVRDTPSLTADNAIGAATPPNEGTASIDPERTLSSHSIKAEPPKGHW